MYSKFTIFNKSKPAPKTESPQKPYLQPIKSCRDNWECSTKAPLMSPHYTVAGLIKVCRCLSTTLLAFQERKQKVAGGAVACIGIKLTPHSLEREGSAFLLVFEVRGSPSPGLQRVVMLRLGCCFAALKRCFFYLSRFALFGLEGCFRRKQHVFECLLNREFLN